MPYRLAPSEYARTCQFIRGYDAQGLALFCGHRSTAGSSYCAEHYPRIYQRAIVFDARRFIENLTGMPAPRPEPEGPGTAGTVAEQELERATAE